MTAASRQKLDQISNVRCEKWMKPKINAYFATLRRWVGHRHRRPEQGMSPAHSLLLEVEHLVALCRKAWGLRSAQLGFPRAQLLA